MWKFTINGAGMAISYSLKVATQRHLRPLG